MTYDVPRDVREASERYFLLFINRVSPPFIRFHSNAQSDAMCDRWNKKLQRKSRDSRAQIREEDEIHERAASIDLTCRAVQLSSPANFMDILKTWRYDFLRFPYFFLLSPKVVLSPTIIHDNIQPADSIKLVEGFFLDI